MAPEQVVAVTAAEAPLFQCPTDVPCYSPPDERWIQQLMMQPEPPSPQNLDGFYLGDFATTLFFDNGFTNELDVPRTT